MTRDELIELAKEVGMCGMLTDVVTTIDELERFAALVAADALELADKRIAEEREQHDIMMERGAEKLAEAERKLSVARQACKDIRRAIERECYAAAYIIVSEALAQIGGEDAR